MQIGALNRSRWAGFALLTALAFASAQAAPLAREDAASTDSGASVDDNADSNAAAAASVAATNNTSPNRAAIAAPTAAAAVAAKTASASAVVSAAPAQDRDMGRSIREVSKPILEELAHSDVAEAVRALDTRSDKVNAGLDEDNQAEDSRDSAARRRGWDGTGPRPARDGNAQQPGLPRDPERDKVRANMLMSGLIDEIKPWAIGAAVLYVLAYIAKFTLAARRRTVQRRLERRKYKRTSSGQNSRHGGP